jgi:Fibronectin type 3 domain-containing protein
VNLAVVNTTETTVALKWAKPKQGDAVLYKVYRDGQEIATVSTTNFEDTGLRPETTYVYIVKAVDADENLSEASNAVTVKTAREKVSAPLNLRTVAVTETTVKLEWTKPEKGNVVSYKVYRDGQEIATVSATNFEDTGLKPATRYVYTVKAVDVDGSLSDTSNALTVTTAREKVSAPLNLRAVLVTDRTVKLEWVKPAKGTVVSYKVYRDDVEIATVNSTNFEDTGVRPETIYLYTVRAVDTDGSLSEEVRHMTKTLIEVLTAPTNLRATKITETEVSLEWVRPSDGTVAEYRVYDSNTSTTVTVTQPKVVITGLIPDTIHTYTVTAVSPSGRVSSQSNVVRVATKKEVVETPRNLNLVTLDKNSVTIRWDATGQKNIQGYRILLDGKEHAIYQSNQAVVTYVIKNIKPGEWKNVQIQAIGKYGTYSARSTSLDVRIPVLLEETKIHTAMDRHRPIRTNASGNVTITDVSQEKFYIEHIEGDIYRIWNSTRDKILTRVNGTNSSVGFVTVSGSALNTTQKWKLTRYADASYIIENVHTKTVLDVRPGFVVKNIAGAEIALGARNGGIVPDNQRFFLTAGFANKIEITTRANANIKIAINPANNIVLHNNASQANTTFYLEKVLNGESDHYRIWNSTRDSILVRASNGSVQFVPASNKNIKDQYWDYSINGIGQVEIRLSGTNLYWDCEGERTTNNTRIILWQRTGRLNQSFIISPK